MGYHLDVAQTLIICYLSSYTKLISKSRFIDIVHITAREEGYKKATSTYAVPLAKIGASEGYWYQKQCYIRLVFIGPLPKALAMKQAVATFHYQSQ
jgi:hypothetical protein